MRAVRVLVHGNDLHDLHASAGAPVQVDLAPGFRIVVEDLRHVHVNGLRCRLFRQRCNVSTVGFDSG